MITHAELVHARDALLDRTVTFFVGQPDVLGIFLAGSVPAGSADAYSDLDLRVIATHEGRQRLVEGRLDWPSHWGDVMFNEWIDGTNHCVSHFRPFLKVDVFYRTPDDFRPSPWFRMPCRVLLDREGIVQRVLAESQSLTFERPPSREVSRVLSKAMAGAHEVVRRARRGELHFAQTLLDEVRSHMVHLDGWIHGRETSVPQDLRVAARISPDLLEALGKSYVALAAHDIEEAMVRLGLTLAQQIADLHRRFDLNRPLDADLFAIELVTKKRVAF